MRTALLEHPLLSHVSDYTREFDAPDFQFRLDGHTVRLELKRKGGPYSEDYRELWSEVPPDDLFMLDETSYRHLMWGEGMGLLLIEDVPRRRWHVFGPWELCLGPNRRFERRGDRGAGEFAKGKLLLDLRTASATTPDLSVNAVVDTARGSRRALSSVEAVRIRSREALPLVPRELARMAEAVKHQEAEPPNPIAAPSPEVDVDRAWCGLGPRLVAGIKEHFGWDEPTDVQRLAFPVVLVGDNVLILAPTAGGKTEAALLPLLDRLHTEGGRCPSILAISPLKALLDDQRQRYERLAGLVGATAFAWHGDVSWEAKRAFLDEPTTIMLTTPESLESLLASPSRDHVGLFAGLGAVVVDEVHAFVGTPRGAQLASLLERLDRFVDADLQRVGLSATVGNPEEVLAWLRGGSLRDARVIDAQARMRGEQVRIETYDGAADAVATIGSLIANDRSLVFTRSRRRAEELGNGLGVPVHHSSVSGGRRAATVQAFASGSAQAIVATSSLEMGIDLGEIDLIVHDGPPTGPGSYLQRLGRSGRRSGLRKLVFTTDDADELLLILAVLARVRRGDLERLPPRRGARLVLGQQVLGLVLERTLVPRREPADALRWTEAFHASADDIEATVAHLLAGGWLAEAQHHLVAGRATHARFGGSRVGDLAVTFDARGGADVLDERGELIGTVDWSHLEQEKLTRQDQSLVLAGRPWDVVSVDRAGGIVLVRPATRGKPIGWRGTPLDIDRGTWSAAREVLTQTDVAVAMDSRAADWLAEARSRWKPRLQHPVRVEGSSVVVDSFAGAAVHRGVLHALGCNGDAEGATCTFELPLGELSARAADALARFDGVMAAEAARIAPSLPVRFPDLVAPTLLVDEAREFHVDDDGFRAVFELLAGGT